MTLYAHALSPVFAQWGSCNSRYEEGAQCLCKEIEFHAASDNFPMIAKLVLAVVLVKLTLEDYVAAEHFFRSAGKYVQMSFVCGKLR